ncbi:hypothetical protein [Rothia uropygialis]|uniref:hypothetical protein n=1 Tax=Kocuria sp. 36 TaxID=1415402 RepID=UPI001930FE31|nr:hypothetical protein [Kocuria sp. 36]
MNTAKKTTAVGTGALLSLGLLGGILAPANAAEAPSAQTQQASEVDAQKSIKQVDDSNLAFRLPDGVKLVEDGSAVVAKDGSKQALPSESKDKNGNGVALKYAEKDGVVSVNVISQDAANTSQTNTYLGKGAKCGLGTGGSAGTGAIAGGAAGATIGSAVPVAGTVTGWAVGTAIGGAVSGGAVGAATFC